MNNSKVREFLSSGIRLSTVALLGATLPLFAAATKSKPSAPAPKAAPSSAKSSPSSTKTGSSASGSKTGTGSSSAGTSHGSTANTSHSQESKAAVKTPPGGSQKVTKSGAVVTKNASGKTVGVTTKSGAQVKYASSGRPKEVRSADGHTVVQHGPGGVRRTVVERDSHTRLVAEGHGRGYIQHTYVYGGRSYYSRNYYYHGGYYNAYYHGYYYHGVYLNGYMPAYYYPSAYYGWAYNPWPAPVAYGWGWGASPWYGYYGAYFAPYPVYPSASYWLADYLVAASLADAYAVAAAANNAQLHDGNRSMQPHLIYASYDPATGTTSPTMTKEVKDAVSQEIGNELALQKAATPGDADAASLTKLLADGKPHVFVASAALTVTSDGADCGLTQGDVLSLGTAPATDAATADLSVLASKKTDCPKGNTVSVELADLQEMHNQLLSSIDKGMAEMKDHPGKGGLPAPPADAIAGTKQAPYAAAAPPADADGAAQLDKAADDGKQVEQEAVAEASTAESDGTTTAEADAPAAAAAPAQPAAPKKPIALSLGQTPEQVVAAKGEPISKAKLGLKTIYIYSDMKIIFMSGKLSDIQ
jgi:hypothetical protein